ncbi:MAG: methyltransferase domain-containing protein [Candidatus Bathyarchaeota archaeon]|nr:methyltransferase domain-containing protein [Candidatus Bathyarchaeota archaeon]
MHAESFELMRYFVDNYLDKSEKLEIADIGSYDVNGSYKSLFDNPNWNYSGIDMKTGPNVDYVTKAPFDFGLEKQFDIVVSGNCMEHVEAPWKWIKEVEKINKKGGLVCIITPFSIGQHRHPIDCWRVLPDGYRYLLEQESEYKVLETRLNKPAKKYKIFSSRPGIKWMLKLMPHKVKDIISYRPIQDTYVIAQKN